jgi:hypothetical protein
MKYQRSRGKGRGRGRRERQTHCTIPRQEPFTDLEEGMHNHVSYSVRNNFTGLRHEVASSHFNSLRHSTWLFFLGHPDFTRATKQNYLHQHRATRRKTASHPLFSHHFHTGEPFHRGALRGDRSNLLVLHCIYHHGSSLSRCILDDFEASWRLAAAFSVPEGVETLGRAICPAWPRA